MRALQILIVALLCVASAHALSIFHDPNPVVSTTDSSFTVHWTTDVDAVGSVAYGRSINDISGQKQNNTPMRSHTITIDGLASAVDYYFSIISVAVNSSAIDDNGRRYYHVYTRGKTDNTPPRISNVSVQSSGSSSVVTWTTDEESSSAVWYDKPLKTQSSDQLVNVHELSIDTVQDKTYSLIVGSCDDSDNCANMSTGFYAGVGTSMNVSIPQYTRFNRVDVKGTTVPGATVRLSINGASSRAMVVGSDGAFSFKDVDMGGTQATITVSSKDVNGNVQEKSVKVTSDSTPPIVTFTQGIPDYAGSTSLTISGTVNKPVELTYYTAISGQAPTSVGNVRTTMVTANTIALEWDAVEGISRYAVYRDGKRIAIVNQNRYTDSVSSGSLYKYTVSAISKGCQESSLSNALSVQTATAGLVINITPQEVAIDCGQTTQHMQISGSFSFSMQLLEGENAVVLEFKDKAGNVLRVTNTTIVDITPPQFLENNLDQLSPTYTQSIEIRGKLNKQGTVFIYLNKDKPIAVLTNKNGGFSKEIDLSRDATLKTTKAPISAIAETSEGWTNQVKLEAVDLAGRKVSVGPTPITYAICGFGSTFQVQVGQPLPQVLTPRLMLQGVQQAGFSINASYRGGRELSRQGTISIRPVTVSAAEGKKYDFDRVRIDFLRDPRNPTSGYVQLNFVPQDAARTDNKTMGSREINLSNHRMGECKVPGMGCIRLLLEVEVKATEKIPKLISDPRVQTTTGNFIQNDVSQRTCIDIELQIDKALPLSQNIPKKFLESSVEFLDEAMKLLDKVLDPMITVGTYTTYGCMAMNGVLFGTFFAERMSCDYANVQDKGVIGAIEMAIGKNSMRDIAEIGICDDVFKNPQAVAITAGQGAASSGAEAQKKAAAYQACKSCENAVSRRKSIENKMRLVCDRVACPSAPTLQTYIKDNQKTKPKQVIIPPDSGLVMTSVRNNINGQIYNGNSCSFKGQGGQRLSTGYSSLGTDAREFTITGTDKNGQPTGFKKNAQGPDPYWKIGADGKTATPTTPYGYPGEYPGGFTVKDGQVYGTRLGSDTPEVIAPLTTTTQVAPTPDEALALQGFTAGKSSFSSSPFSVSFVDMGIKDIYIKFLKHQKDKEPTIGASAVTVVTSSSNVNCAGLHPANPECCGTEYYQEWGSACGLPPLIETFDEIKESACLAAQNANQIPNFEREVQQAAGTQITCKSLFNSVAGFCEPGSGQPVGEDLPTGITYRQDIKESLAAPKNNEVYIRIEPVGAENDQYVIVRGYIAERIARQKLANKQDQMAKEAAAAEALRKDKTTDAKDQFYLNAELDFVPDLDPAADLSNWFSDNPAAFSGNDKGTAIANAIREGNMPPGFDDALCVNAADLMTCKGTYARRVYLNIRSRLGVTDKVYIVRPDRDGVLRSAQCVCLPAVTSYLSFWRNILGAVRNCFETVRVTGDASAGVCQAVLSQYVCDMLWDVLSCFTQKYSTPGYGKQFSGQGGIGDIMGALSGAGGDMQRSINTRYGDTALWKSMFVERKLLHSVCAFAFTGTWDLDMAGIYAQTVNEIPIKSQGFLYPSDRRFISYNPTTNPPGLATFTYHFGAGLIAGDELRYELVLKCSNSLRCEPRDGFAGGKCDCFGKKEITMPVGAPELGSGTLKKNDILNAEVFYTIQGSDAYSTVRYDTAILRWESLNPLGGQVVSDKVEVPIHVVGQSPPNFCQIDPLQGMFRCDIGIGDYTGAKFSEPPTPHYPQGSSAFTTQKPIQFDVSVNLQYPSTARQEAACISGSCPYTKWINYEIKNQAGQTIAGPLKPEEVTSRPELKIEAQGETQRTITIKTLTENDFTHAQTKSSGVVGGGPNDGAFATVEKTKGIMHAFILVITPKDSNRYTWEIFNVDTLQYQSKPPAPRTSPVNGQWGWFRKDPSDKPLAGPTEFVAATTTPVNLTDYGIQFLVNPMIKIDQPAEYFVQVDQVGTQSKTICEQYQTSPGQWTATFKLYDSTAVAGGTVYEYNALQNTVDPSTGEVQSVDVPFGAVCAESFNGSVGTAFECPSDARLNVSAQKKQCYCGDKAGLADANAKLLADKTAKVLNCGWLLSGDFCVYDDPTKPTQGRHCDVEPQVTPPTGPTTPPGLMGPPAPLPAPATTPIPVSDVSITSTLDDMSVANPSQPWTHQSLVDLSQANLASAVKLIPNAYSVTFSFYELADQGYTGDVYIDKMQAGVASPGPFGQFSYSFKVSPPADLKEHTLMLVLKRKDGNLIGSSTLKYVTTAPVILRCGPGVDCTSQEQFLRSRIDSNLLDIRKDDTTYKEVPGAINNVLDVGPYRIPDFDPAVQGNDVKLVYLWYTQRLTREGIG